MSRSISFANFLLIYWPALEKLIFSCLNHFYFRSEQFVLSVQPFTWQQQAIMVHFNSFRCWSGQTRWSPQHIACNGWVSQLYTFPGRQCPRFAPWPFCIRQWSQFEMCTIHQQLVWALRVVFVWRMLRWVRFCQCWSRQLLWFYECRHSLIRQCSFCS